ncbi:sulfotransferase [Pseudomonas veronii]|uniref:Sulfotransferase n=1 Tax=Pseudomonas veronii TaxID=76761 RepID=A0ABS0VNY9_PSEVE|nr:sulfotransferase [Pseudomonas veronii]MBI6553356.1 sulfotransferase [Pseudomonas veronii]MBI6653258.1 sulfotransferase [Pseudomonas veronii]WRU61036.1 sulfotransferase [Pseudomonas veronii]
MSEKIKQAFIIGTGRCGTTWLAQMLNSNPALCVPPEIQLLFEYSGNGNRLYEEYLLAKGQGLDSDQLISIIERGCPHNLDQFFDYPAFCRQDSTPKRSFREFVTAFYTAVAQSHGKRWLIEQTPWYGQRLDLVTTLFPEAKFIHVVRDGRDVALSFSRTTWWHRSARLNLSRWQREIKKIALDAKCFVNPEAYLEVKYENLVADTTAELKKICKFLGVDFDPVMLDPQGFIDYDQFCKFDMGQVSSQAYSVWRKQKSKTVFADNVEAWRRNGNAFDKSLPPEISNWLSHYGYPIETPDEAETENLHLREYSLNALEQDNLEKSQHIQKLEQSVADYAQHIGNARLVEKDWAARGELLEHLGSTIHALEQDNAERVEKNHALERALAGQMELATHIKDQWQARGDLIDHLGEKFKALEQERAACAELTAALQQTLAAHAEQIVVLEQALQARELLLEQVGEANEALKRNSADRSECINVLERSLAEQIKQSEVAEKHLNTRERLIQQLTASVDELNSTSKQQAEKIQQLMFDAVVSANTNSELVQKIADQKLLLEDLEGRLNEFERSWYGILRKRLSK